MINLTNFWKKTFIIKTWIILVFLITLLSVVLKDFRYVITFLIMSISFFILFFSTNLGLKKILSFKKKLIKNINTSSLVLKMMVIFFIKFVIIGLFFYLSTINKTILSWEVTLVLITLLPIMNFILVKEKNYEN